MSTEPPEGVVSPGALLTEAGAVSPGAPAMALADGALKPEADAQRTVRMVPRPASSASGSGAGGPPSRKGTHPGVATVTGEPLGSASAASVPAPPPPVDIPMPAPMPQLPEARALLAAEDAAATERRPEMSADVGSPPEIRRFLSPPPTAPSTEPGSGPASEPTARRRSRRTVKIPDDAVPQKTASVTPPPVVAPAPAVVAPPSPSPSPSLNAAPGLQVIPASPQVPVLAAPRPAPAIPRVSPRPRPAGGAAPVSTGAPSVAASDEPPRMVTDPVAAAPDVETYEIIRPMRIINIGTLRPPPAPEATPAEASWDDVGHRPSRPPMHASAELEAFASPPAVPPPAPLPKPPVVEEVEAVAEEEPEPPITAPTLLRARPLEIESIPDDEIVADRISDHATDLVAHDDIAIDVVLDAPAPKKPPPPPPKRATTLEPPPLSMPSPPTSSASPPPTRAVEAVAALPASPATAATAAPATPPPPPPPPPLALNAAPPAPALASNAAPASARENAQTLDLSRKRVKPWWEEIFSDDYLRTMEKVEPKAIKKECDFIEDRLGLEKGAIMLDLACGPGSHAVELASRGYNVVGYDLSLAMLARAQDEAQERGQKINFLQGDMREMAFQEAFDGIYSWSTSFGYFDDEKNVDVLARMHRALRQGGMLLLDVANRDYICPRQPSLVWFEGEGCVCMDEMYVDFFSSRLRVKRTVMFEDGRARECDYAIRIYGLHELGKMLHDTGFKVVEVTGHPSHPGVFFGSESPRIIVLAERA